MTNCPLRLFASPEKRKVIDSYTNYSKEGGITSMARISNMLMGTIMSGLALGGVA